MKGTEKQVKWAEEIKAGTYRTLDWLDSLFADRFYTPARDCNYVSPEAVAAVRSEMDSLFARVDSAAAIIDKRDMFGRSWIIKHARAWMSANGQDDQVRACFR